MSKYQNEFANFAQKIEQVLAENSQLLAQNAAENDGIDTSEAAHDLCQKTIAAGAKVSQSWGEIIAQLQKINDKIQADFIAQSKAFEEANSTAHELYFTLEDEEGLREADGLKSCNNH